MGFEIKDKCEQCGSDEDLDGIIKPFYNEDKKLLLERETLCAPCKKEFFEMLEEFNSR